MANTKKILSAVGFVFLVFNTKAQFVENPTGTLATSDKVILNSSETLGGLFNPDKATLNIGQGSIRLLLDNNEIYNNNNLHFGTPFSNDFIF